MFDLAFEVGGFLFGFECSGAVFDVVTVAGDIVSFAVVIA